MNDLEVVGNWIEAVLWLGVSLTLLAKAIKTGGRLRKLFLILAAAFLVFGISDAIETQTGAWWRPVWLLFMKGACVLVFFAGFREYYRLTRKKGDH
jgi:hypothetical protein